MSPSPLSVRMNSALGFGSVVSRGWEVLGKCKIRVKYLYILKEFMKKCHAIQVTYEYFCLNLNAADENTICSSI